MKKLFLIPLMTLMCSVMAWGATVEVGTFEQLKAAIDGASNGDVIKLTADIDYDQVAYTDQLNITKSITLDGQGHTLKGAGQRQSSHSTYATIWVNLNGTEDIDVTFKDIKIINGKKRADYNDMAIHTRGHLHGLTLQNVYLESPTVPLQLGGNHTGLAYTTEISIENSYLHALDYYPILSWNKYNLVANNTKFEGWCSLYFKGVNGSIGSRGSVIVANNCQFNAPNVHSGHTNAFGMFVCEDDGISITLNNCSMDAEQLGDQSQAVLVLSGYANRRTEAVSLTVNGDNSYINGKWVDNDWPTKTYSVGTDEHGNKVYAGCYTDGSFFLENPETGNYDGEFIFKYPQYAPSAYTAPINLTFTGGTYSQNPASTTLFPIGITPVEAEDEPGVIQYGAATIPDGYEVKEIETQQGDQVTTLYRVRKTIGTSNSINDNVEGQGAGVNANTEFLISGNETVAANSTVAHYVEVSNNATLTLPQGKTLEVTNGLDVTGGATMEVEAGSTLIVGEGGVTSEDVNSIVIEANENGSASFLLDPEVIVNTTPNVTIKMTAKQIGYEMDEEEQEYYWFRFAAPVAGIEAIGKDKDRPTYIYKWNYAADDWSSISALSELVPFQGFSLTTNHEGLEDVTYTFQGRLAGNQDMSLQFQSRGYNYFGNSYTGYIDAVALIQQLMENDAIDGVVYMWDNTYQRFKDVPLGDLAAEPVDSWKRQIAPMQTFILRQINTGEPTSTTINYASAIWGNPRYGIVPASAPARKFANNSNVNKLTVVVSAANGKVDDITFKEGDEFSDEYNKGFEAVKYMNERQINLYSTIDNENYGTVATNNIEGKLINMKTVKALDYTMSFENVNSEEYAIRDNVTGAIINITEGNTYEFTAQPNSTVEGRFEIVNRHNAPTAIENTEVKANVKGIYTIMGQYLGEDFDVLPAGVYVVNGVKIVK